MWWVLFKRWGKMLWPRVYIRSTSEEFQVRFEWYEAFLCTQIPVLWDQMYVHMCIVITKREKAGICYGQGTQWWTHSTKMYLLLGEAVWRSKLYRQLWIHCSCLLSPQVHRFPLLAVSQVICADGCSKWRLRCFIYITREYTSMCSVCLTHIHQVVHIALCAPVSCKTLYLCIHSKYK